MLWFLILNSSRCVSKVVRPIVSQVVRPIVSQVVRPIVSQVVRPIVSQSVSQQVSQSVVSQSVSQSASQSISSQSVSQSVSEQSLSCIVAPNREIVNENSFNFPSAMSSPNNIFNDLENINMNHPRGRSHKSSINPSRVFY